MPEHEVRPAQEFVFIVADQPSQHPVLDTGIIVDVGNDIDPCIKGDHVAYLGSAKEIHYMGRVITRQSNIIEVLQHDD